MVKKYLVFGFSLVCVVLFSGCLSMNPEAFAYANPLVKQFMSEYPNAEIQITHFTAIQSIPLLENITSECGKNVSAKEYYRIMIDDPDSGLKVTAWIDWENKMLECAVKYGTGEDKSISKPGEPIKTCKSHAEFRCYGEHVFWFDSCGHKQEKKEYCQEGCELGFCREKERKTCEEMDGYCVYPALAADASSITGMITGQPTAVQPVCIDSDNGKNYHEKGHVYTGESKLWDHCNDDGTLTEKYCTNDGQMAAIKVSCPAGGKCDDGICVGGEGETSEKEEIITDLVCKEGYVKAEYWCPENGICCTPKKIECEPLTQVKCYEGHVFWFDSCGNRGAKKEYCEYGCSENKCMVCEDYRYSTCPDKCEKRCVSSGCEGDICTTDCEGSGSCFTPEKECWDSDGGKDYHEKGTATKGEQSLSDHCNDDGTLTEKYCENNEIKAEQVECPYEYTCYNGKCNPKNVSECTPHYMHECHSGHVYWHNSCEIPEEIKETCDFLCYIDRCVSKEETECIDPDASEDYIYSEVTIKIKMKSTGDIIKYEKDFCNKETGVLVEHYCENGEIKTEEIECTYGCYENYGRCEIEIIEAKHMAECENGNLYGYILNTGNRPLETSHIKVIEWVSEEEITGSWDKSVINPEDYAVFESDSYEEGTSYRPIYYPDISEEYPNYPLVGKKWPGVCREKVFIDTITESEGQITMTGHISLNETDVSGNKTFSIKPVVNYWGGGPLIHQKQQTEIELSVPITGFDEGWIYFGPTTETITFGVEWSADYLEEHTLGHEILFGGYVYLECTPDCDESEDSDLKKL